MYTNRAGNEITDESYNKLSPNMKAKYSKMEKVAKEVKETKPATDIKEDKKK